MLKNVYAGATFEAANVWPDRKDISISEMILGGNLFLGVDTFFGPLYLAYGRAEHTDEGTISLYLGKIF